MDSLARIYTKGVHEELEFYYAQWLPTEKMEIGVVGELLGSFFSGYHLFRPLTTLKDLGIRFSPEEDILPDNSPASLNLKSQYGVSFVSKTAGQATIKGLPNIPKANAGFSYEFADEGGFVLKAEEVYEPRIRDVPKLERGIMRSFEKGHWRKNYAVVYSVIQAEHADMLVAKTGSSKIEFEVQGTAVVGPVDLGSADVKLARKSETGSVMDLSNSKNVTPLFKLVGIKNRWIFEDDFGALGFNKTNTLQNVQPKITREGIKSEHFYLDILRYDPNRPQTSLNFNRLE